MAAPIKLVGEEGEIFFASKKKDLCNICVTKESRYTCPRCNMLYCSLTCYQHQNHQGCSEEFYRDCVVQELKKQSAKPEDRQKILEMLAREHEEQLLDDDDGDETDVPGLAKRLQGLDLDKDGGEIWHRLTQKEREEFARMLKDGRLANLVDVWTPWWTQSQGLIQEISGEEILPNGYPVHLSNIPDISQLLKQTKPSSDVKHNLINVLGAYVFVTRLFNGCHHDSPVESAEGIFQVCAVLRENRTCSDVKDAIQLVLQDIQKGKDVFIVQPSFPVVLIGDVINLISGNQNSSLTLILSALSDLAVLLKTASREFKKAIQLPEKQQLLKDSISPNSSFQQELFRAKKKIIFFISWAKHFGACLASLAVELNLELECLKMESAETEALKTAVEEHRKAGKPKLNSHSPLVQELE